MPDSKRLKGIIKKILHQHSPQRDITNLRTLFLEWFLKGNMYELRLICVLVCCFSSAYKEKMKELSVLSLICSCFYPESRNKLVCEFEGMDELIHRRV